MKKDFDQWAVKISLLAGMILVVFLILIGVIKLIPSTISSLASVGTSLNSTLLKPSERIEVSANKSSINSNEEFALTWNHVSKDSSGFYVFNYECKDNLSINTSVNGKAEKVLCNTSFPINSSENIIKLTPVLNKADSYVDVKLSIGFVEEGKTTAKVFGTIPVVIKNGSVTTVNQTNTNTTTKTNVVATTPTVTYPTVIYTTPNTYSYVSYPTENQFGVSNLTVRIIQTGRVDRYSNVFSPTSQISRSDRAAVVFEVANTGSKESGPWIFTATLPTDPTQTFTSYTQPSLGAGETRQLTLAFDNVKIGGYNNFTINLDPYNSVYESNKNDNSSTISIVAY